MTLGGRVDADDYNGRLYREGKGWLPAHLDGAVGDLASLTRTVPARAASTHPALELFRAGQAGGLEAARFPRWWKLSTWWRLDAGIPVASLRGAGTEFWSANIPGMRAAAPKNAGRHASWTQPARFAIVCAAGTRNQFTTSPVRVPTKSTCSPASRSACALMATARSKAVS